MPRGFQRARQGPSARQIDHLAGHERPVQDDVWLVLVPRRSNRRRGVSTMSESRHRRRILAQATPQSRRACSHATWSTSCPLQISSRSLTNSFVTKPSVPDAISTSTCGRTYASVDETVVTFELPGDLRGCMLRSSVRWGRTWIAAHGGGDHCQEEAAPRPRGSQLHRARRARGELETQPIDGHHRAGSVATAVRASDNLSQVPSASAQDHRVTSARYGVIRRLAPSIP